MSIKSTLKKIAAIAMTTVIGASMMAINASAIDALPDPNQEATLTIHKYAEPTWGDTYKNNGEELTIPTGALALQGVEFTIWKIADIGANTSNISEATLAGMTTGALDTEYGAGTKKTTDADGIAKFEDVYGIYYVRETAKPASVTSSIDFIVSAPMTSVGTDAYTKWNYNVHAYPKNATATDTPTIEKDITVIGNDNDGFAYDEQQTWIIYSTIPTTIADYTKYEISDVIDDRLDYRETKVYTGADYASKTEVPVANYTLTDIDGKNIKVAFNETGIAALRANETIYVEIKTTIVEDNANVAVEIPNPATVTYDYTNKPSTDTGVAEVPEANRPKAYTTGLKVKKVDDQGTALAGATFKLATTEANAKAGTFMTVNGVSEWTTGADGMITIAGLDSADTGTALESAGRTYYLVETKAPNGYSLLATPVAVTVNSKSFDANEYVGQNSNIVNYPHFELPSTGGMGTMIFTVCGVALMALAGVMFIKTKKAKAN